MSRAPIPVNLIGGALGTGKTTTINHLLAQRPPDAFWAVLINEYGLVGLDEALLTAAQGDDGIAVREVAGGCICCTAGLMFEVALVRLLRRRPDRLLIEPTGLATLSGILETLSRPGIREHVDVRAIVTLVEPGQIPPDEAAPATRDQIDAADVLLASRADLASPDQLAGFHAWAATLFPPKRHVGQVVRGQLDRRWLDLVAHSAGVSADPHHAHAHHHPQTAEALPQPSAEQPLHRRAHAAAGASTLGWLCWSGWVFDAARIERWLLDLADRPGALRVKAAVCTNLGWRGYNFAGEARDVHHTGHRRDTRLEAVFQGPDRPDADALERALRACVITDDAPTPIPAST